MLRYRVKRAALQGEQSSGKKSRRVNSDQNYQSSLSAPLGQNYSDEEEKNLEKFILGGEADVINRLSAEETQKVSETPVTDTSVHDLAEAVSEEKSNLESLKPAWEDEDDNRELIADRIKLFNLSDKTLRKKSDQKYSDHLKSQFEKIVGTPKWAQLDRKPEPRDSEDDEDRILRRTGKWIDKPENLGSAKIDVRKCTMLNSEEVSTTYIKNVEFHRQSQVALVASKHGTVTLFQVDGKNNPKIQSVHFKKFQINMAHFSANGEEIIVGSGLVPYFYTYNMINGKLLKFPENGTLKECSTKSFSISPDGNFIVLHGKFGKMHLITAKSKESVTDLKMNGKVYATAFSPDGSTMYSHGDNGQVYVWDMRNRVCTHKFFDEGCIQGTTLAVSPNYQYLATGADSGVVNIYNASEILTSPSPKPIKSFMNLTTSVSGLRFNCTSEILFFSSCLKQNALKLAHFPSMRVFPNFPGLEYKFKMPESIDVSPGSAYFSVGNNAGLTYLFRLQHYSNY